jgi:methyl-accepting chemotaxis protein
MRSRRKNYFIKKKFQINFFYKFILLLILESILIVSLFLYISRNSLTTGYLNSILRVEPTWDFFFIPFVLIALIVVLGISLAGMIVFILLSHRIAGPLHRFEKVLEELSAGDFTTKVHLRNTDQLVDFKEKLNFFIEILCQRIIVIKAKLEEAQGLIKQTQDPQLISKLKQKLDGIQEEINRFKTSCKF